MKRDYRERANSLACPASMARPTDVLPEQGLQGGLFSFLSLLVAAFDCTEPRLLQEYATRYNL